MHKLHIIPALTDNYIWLLTNSNGQCIIIDPAIAAPVIDYITKHKISPIGILLTHHHADHIGGVEELQKYYPNIHVYGPSEINLPINDITGKKTISISDFHFNIIDVPGHTLGHVAYYCEPYLFCGDVLFSAGCGRVFNKNYVQMLDSLNKLKRLPDDTQICAGHEYTISNLKFAKKMMSENQDINQYFNLISKKTITLPSLLGKEKQINLFLQCDNQKIQNKFNCNNELELFIFFRIQKDNF